MSFAMDFTCGLSGIGSGSASASYAAGNAIRSTSQSSYTTKSSKNKIESISKDEDIDWDDSIIWNNIEDYGDFISPDIKEI